MRNSIHIEPVDNSELSAKTKAALIELIRSQESDEPFKLPSEDQLSQMMGVSRNALRDVLASLEEMGLVTRQRSKGTLGNPKVARETCRLDTDPGLFSMIRQMGRTPRTDMTSVGMVQKNDPLMGAECQAYLEVSKRFYADDVPVVLTIDHILGELAEGKEELFPQLEKESCFSFLKRSCRVPVAYSMATFDVAHADAQLQELFQVGPEELFLVIDDIVYSKDLKIVCHARSYYRKGYLPVKVLRKGW